MGDWLDRQHRLNAERLVAEWPEVGSGMFVQLDSWFGDVWAEITSAYSAWEDPSQRSVTFMRYEKHGVSRKADHAYYGYIRKFATRDQIDFTTAIVHIPNASYSYGRVVEWPEGRSPRRDRGGYELHPTLDKPVR